MTLNPISTRKLKSEPEPDRTRHNNTLTRTNPTFVSGRVRVRVRVGFGSGMYTSGPVPLNAVPSYNPNTEPSLTIPDAPNPNTPELPRTRTNLPYRPTSTGTANNHFPSSKPTSCTLRQLMDFNNKGLKEH